MTYIAIHNTNNAVVNYDNFLMVVKKCSETESIVNNVLAASGEQVDYNCV